MRTPDVILKFTIKKRKVGSEWIARCSALPNCEYAAESVPDLLDAIDEGLHDEFEDASYIDGGITSLNAEYAVFRRKDQTLSQFLTNQPNQQEEQNNA